MKHTIYLGFSNLLVHSANKHSPMCVYNILIAGDSEMGWEMSVKCNT